MPKPLQNIKPDSAYCSTAYKKDDALKLISVIVFMLFFIGLLNEAKAAEGRERQTQSDAYEDDSEARRPIYDEEAPVQEGNKRASVSAGGLAAPDAFETDDKKSEIEKDLEKSDRRDSDRGIEFAYVSGDIGMQWLTFKTPVRRVSQSMPSFGAAVGARFLYFTLGGRFTSSQAKEFYAYSAATELGLKLPFGALEPHLLFGIGYTQIGEMNESLLGVVPGAQDKPRLGGVDFRLGAGFDYFLSPTFSVGLLVSGGWLRFLSTPEVDGIRLADDTSGGQLRTSFVLGLHI